MDADFVDLLEHFDPCAKQLIFKTHLFNLWLRDQDLLRQHLPEIFQRCEQIWLGESDMQKWKYDSYPEFKSSRHLQSKMQLLMEVGVGTLFLPPPFIRCWGCKSHQDQSEPKISGTPTSTADWSISFQWQSTLPEVSHLKCAAAVVINSKNWHSTCWSNTRVESNRTTLVRAIWMCATASVFRLNIDRGIPTHHKQSIYTGVYIYNIYIYVVYTI